MRVFTYFFLSLFLISLAWANPAMAQTKARIVIAEGGDLDRNYSPTGTNIFGNCATIGSNSCRIHQIRQCNLGSSCVVRTSNGSAVTGPSSSSFHGWASAAAALEDAADLNTHNIEIIYLGGNNAVGKLNWILANATAKNIVAVNMSSGGIGSNNVQAASALANINVVLTIPAGNVGKNGFNPSHIGVFTPIADQNGRIDVGGGFDPRGENCVTSQGELIVDHEIDLWCKTNAPDNAGANFFIEQACAPGYTARDGGACGTSFAAPRVAAVVAELKYTDPSKLFPQIITALANYSAGTDLRRRAKGHDGRSYKRIDLENALNVTTSTELEALLEYSIVDPNSNGYTDLIVRDVSRSGIPITNRIWTTNGTNSVAEIDNGEAIKTIAGAGYKGVWGRPSEVTLQVSNSAMTKTISINIEYPPMPHFNPCPQAIKGYCENPVIIKHNGDYGEEPSIQYLYKEFVFCQASQPKYYLNVFQVGNADLYEFEYKLSGSSNWIPIYTGANKSIMASLPSSQSVNVRMRSFSAWGLSDYSTQSFVTQNCSGGGWGF